MKRKRYLFHVTKPENVDNIINNGIMRSMGGRTTCGVYLSEKPLSWYQPGLEILRVDISGLNKVKASTFLPDSDEVIVWGDVPAWKLTKTGFKSRIENVTKKYINQSI